MPKLKTVGYILGALAALYILGTVARSCFAPTPPAPSVVQQAAQHAASAILTVERADSVLAMHRADSLQLFKVRTQQRADSAQRQFLIRELASLRANIPKSTIPGDTLTVQEIADAAVLRARSLSRALDTAVLVIAADSVALRDAQANTALALQDNGRLAHTLQVTRDTLATFRTVVIPAQPTSSFWTAFQLHIRPAVFAGYCVTTSGTANLCAGVGVAISLGGH